MNSAKKTDLLGVLVNTQTKDEILRIIAARVKAGQKTFITTPYSEFIYRAFRDQAFRDIINSSDLAIPDGIGVLWLAYFLSIPFRLKNYYPRLLEGLAQLVVSGAQILLAPSKIRRIIPEKIPGSDFFWDLNKFAAESGLSVYFLGGYKNTPELVAEKVKNRFVNITVAGSNNASLKSADADSVINGINESRADMLFVAAGPVRQEKWIARNLQNLNVKIAIGVGGTFDYVAGKRRQPPHFVRSIGLEWLYRLFTQPHRIKRIWQGTFGLMQGALRWKIFMSMPFRENVAGVIINRDGKILVGRRIVDEWVYDSSADEEHWQLPQGGVDKGEDPRDAVLREMQEELGISGLQILGEAVRKHTYFWNNALRRLMFNRLKYKGQIQTIYFLKFAGRDADVKIDEREFAAFKWVDKSELKEIIHPIRHKMLNIVLEEIDKYL